jgi:hypothetical protein
MSQVGHLTADQTPSLSGPFSEGFGQVSASARNWHNPSPQKSGLFATSDRPAIGSHDPRTGGTSPGVPLPWGFEGVSLDFTPSFGGAGERLPKSRAVCDEPLEHHGSCLEFGSLQVPRGHGARRSARGISGNAL